MQKMQKIPTEVKSVVSGILEKYNVDFDSLIEHNSSADESVKKVYLSVKEAIMISGLSRSSLSRLWQARKIKVLKMTPGSRSGKILINRANLIKYLQSLEVKY
jgi:hypothetical protein